MDKIVKELIAKYPQYILHIQQRAEDFGWQTVGWKNMNGKLIDTRNSSNFYVPILMTPEQFKENLIIELNAIDVHNKQTIQKLYESNITYLNISYNPISPFK